MDEEKLICLVSGYPEIYDLSDNNYMNHIRKNNIWKEIAAIMGVSDTICKEKWKALRDAYHRSIKRREFKSGDAAKKTKKWRFESQMEFLRPYFHERITKTNIESPIISGDNDQLSDFETLTSPSSASVNSPRSVSRAITTPDLERPGPSSNTTSTIYMPSVNSPQPSLRTTTPDLEIFKNMTARKKKRQLPQSQVADVLQKYLDSRTTSRPEESISPIHSFFKAMADTVVSLSPDLQVKVKNQVFSVVSQAESENLRQRPTTSSISNELESFIPNITYPQQGQPTAAFTLHNENYETQYILQPSQSILQPLQNERNDETQDISKSILQPLQKENERNDETQYILQPSQSILQPFQNENERNDETQDKSQIILEPLQNENERNDETQYIQQPSQRILQPQSQPRYQYIITPKGKIIRVNPNN